MTTTSEPTVARASRPRSPVRTAVLVLVLAGCASPVRKDPETGAPLDTADSARIADSATDTSAPADTHDRATDSGSGGRLKPPAGALTPGLRVIGQP